MSTQVPFGYYPPATADSSPASPTAPASTSAFAMQGLGALITPTTPAGNVLAIISGVLVNNAVTVGIGMQIQLYYGPMVAGVAAPANAASVPAAAVKIGPIQEWATGVTLTTAADLFQPFCV